MLCQNCNQRPATIFAEFNSNGYIVKTNLCAECARKLGIEAKKPKSDPYFSAFFAGVAQKNISCPNCKAEQDYLLETGYVGCPKCYSSFARMDEVIESYHKQIRHVGKIPQAQQNRVSNERAKARIRQQLEKAVENEDYILANELKEKLIKLEDNYGKK